MTVTVGLLVCGFCVLIVVLANISIVNHDRYSELAISQQLRDTVVSAQRGTIYDRNMNELAKSATVYTIALSPKDIDEADRETIATGLAQILGVDHDTVLEKCKENNYYSIVKRKVDQPLVDEVRQFIVDNKLNGISFTEDSKRYYPYGNFAAQLLGFVGTDNQGLSGIEAYYDDELSGTAGRVVSAKNAVGSDMYYEYETTYEATDGYSLVLTIDEVIQHYLETHLEWALSEHHVQEGVTGIVMNVKTGEILAMSSKPDYDPNDPFTILDPTASGKVEALAGTDGYSAALSAAQYAQWSNKAISDFYEPGSVFKVITASTALETGACTLDSTFYCTGSKEVGGHIMHCANANGHGSEDFTHAVINSCNPAFIEIGQAIGIKAFYNYFEAFGFTKRTGVDLPGEGYPEAGATYYNADAMGIVELSSCAFGQSNTVTPLQMITGVAAAVNGGYLVTPHIVKQIIDEDGSIVESRGAEIRRQVISEETSATISAILERVVAEGNSQNAYVAGYRIGGKSGTSQKLNGGDGYIASFCAVAPMDDPEIAVLVLYNNAHSNVSIYGGTIVAPVVGSIMSDVLPYIGVEAVYTEDEMQSVDVAAPSIVGYSLTGAVATLQKNGLTYTTVGGGSTVVRQFPESGQSVPRGSNIIIYTEDVEARTATVPDVAGKSISAAQASLRSVGINMKSTGASTSSAIATTQSIAAGTVVPAGTVLTVEFINTGINDG
ncbi:MAG: penicillin-binding transpeptidase domain-containing protein [Oscillospiraceae bacterium]|nr:penicillin-binding transpeptidase domain-containing protein [Oscillospiraceae bacterium]